MVAIGIHNSLECLTGNGTKYRYREIDVVERVNVIGSQKCKGLIGLLDQLQTGVRNSLI